MSMQFRPLLPHDSPRVYATLLEDPIAFHWRFDGGVPTYDAFVRHLDAATAAQFVIETGGTGLGYAAAYSVDHRLRIAHLALVVPPADRGAGYGRAAIAQLLAACRVVLPVRKYYAEVLEPSGYFVHTLERLPGEREVTLPEHVYANGRYHDSHVVGIPVAAA